MGIIQFQSEMFSLNQIGFVVAEQVVRSACFHLWFPFRNDLNVTFLKVNASFLHRWLLRQLWGCQVVVSLLSSSGWPSHELFDLWPSTTVAHRLERRPFSNLIDIYDTVWTICCVTVLLLSCLLSREFNFGHSQTEITWLISSETGTLFPGV